MIEIEEVSKELADLIKYLYHVKKYTQEQIAIELSYSTRNISALMKKFGIEARNVGHVVSKDKKRIIAYNNLKKLGITGCSKYQLGQIQIRILKLFLRNDR